MLAKSSAGAFSPIELKSIHPLRQPKRETRVKKPSVEEITGLSEDTLERDHPDKIRYPSDRRKGMSLEDALEIAAGIKT
jgi:hypothetical protein